MIYRANIIEKIELLYDKFGAVGKFFVVNLYRKNRVAFDFCIENKMLTACPDCKGLGLTSSRSLMVLWFNLNSTISIRRGVTL